MVRKTCSLLQKKVQTRGVRGQKNPKNANLICERPLCINVIDLDFENSMYNRKSSAVIKVNSTIYHFLGQYI